MLKEYTKLSIHNHFGGNEADLTINRPIGDRVAFDLAKGFEKLRELRKVHQIFVATLAGFFTTLQDGTKESSELRKDKEEREKKKDDAIKAGKKSIDGHSTVSTGDTAEWHIQ